MPILNIQRRMAEQGRIRLGEKVATANGKSRPGKLDKFRFTSANERLINDIAQMYGGTARPWDNAGKAEHEVYTDAKSIPVIVVKGGLSQWMETWSGGGCTHRCDSVTNVLTGELCNPDDPAHINAKPTTRLSVMLRDIETLGTWRLESHGYNAAAELPMLAELAEHVGDLVPASLNLVERTAIKDGKTSRFVVPMLDLAVSKQRLVQIVGAAGGMDAPAQIGGTTPAQIAAPAPNYAAELGACTDVQCCRDLWQRAHDAGHLNDALHQAITARAAELQTPGAGGDPGAVSPSSAAPVESPTPPAPGSTDVDDAWMLLQIAAGKHGIGDNEIRARLEQEYAQPVEDLTADQLVDFIPKVAA